MSNLSDIQRKDLMAKSRWALHDMYRKEKGMEPVSRGGRVTVNYAKWLEKLLLVTMVDAEMKKEKPE